MQPISFKLPGHPQGKGRARAFRAGDTIRHYTPEKTRSYEGMVRLAAETAMAGRAPVESPVAIAIVSVFDIPKGFSKKRRAAALEGGEFPGKKPDLDNIAKAVTDALNGVVFKDDALIVTSRCSKVYGPAPMVMVTVTPL